MGVIMKFKISKENLLKGIQVVQNIVNPKSSLPILSNILIEAEDNKICLTTTDLDIGITHTIESEIAEPGSITLPAKRFLDIIRELPDADVTINTKKNNFTFIESGNCQFKIIGLAKDEFPKLPEFKNKEAVVIEQDVLRDAISLTSFAVSHDETRYILNGILVKIQNEKISLVATDGRRLAIVTRVINNKSKQDISMIIPLKTIFELSRNLKEEGSISILPGSNQALFDLGNTMIISRLVEGEFPDYMQVIPKPSQNKMQFNREELLLSLKRAALLSTLDYQAVKFELFPGAQSKLVLSKTTPDIGESREEVKVQYTGKEMAIGFNPNYLIDALKNLYDTTLELELTEPDKPGVIRKEDYVYIVLPMRLG